MACTKSVIFCRWSPKGRFFRNFSKNVVQNAADSPAKKELIIFFHKLIKLHV